MARGAVALQLTLRSLKGSAPCALDIESRLNKMRSMNQSFIRRVNAELIVQDVSQSSSKIRSLIALDSKINEIDGIFKYCEKKNKWKKK